jgi:phosphatidylglycerol lysyltransferase
MPTFTRLRHLLPITVSLAIIAIAATVLVRIIRHVHLHEVLAQLHRIPVPALAVGVLLVATVFAALAAYEAIMVHAVHAPVSTRRAVLAALIAAPIGHAIGWGALSGGAVRFRIYSAAGVRAREIGKIVVLAALPYAGGLGLLLALALVLEADQAGLILHVDPLLARSAGIALLALHLAYVTLTVRRRTPLPFGSLQILLPTPQLTAVQYAIGVVEVCAGSAVLYVFLPSNPAANLPYLAFVAAYVLSILVGLASSVPAGLGVFEFMLILLLPRLPPAQLIGSVLAYRFVLEVVPLVCALVLFGGLEWRNRWGTRRDRADTR